ncbi:MAG: hypothetical protein U0Z26_01315 [Anaerolineales bacterium]
MTAGTVFSVVAFILIAFLMRNSLFFPKDFGVLAKDLDKKKNATPLERLSELKKMHEENLITTVEYEKKKAEIMKEL